MRRKEVLKALGIFQRATADQLWRMLRPTDRHDRITRDTLNALKGSGLVRVETRLESGHQLWVLTEKGHKEAKPLLPKNVRMSALRKLEYDDEGRPVEADGYDEHSAAVTSTAAVLTGAGYGTPLSWQTEIGHKLPYGYTQYAYLTMRAPDAGVPAMLLEVDRVTEPVDDLVAKLRRYSDWFELPAPKAVRTTRRPPGARRCTSAGGLRRSVRAQYRHSVLQCTVPRLRLVGGLGRRSLYEAEPGRAPCRRPSSGSRSIGSVCGAPWS
ncbi:replication-relaxation family protein [Streptomyces goshikiensis]|uniref:replication-relaxation family protein n=1 Tax=Streptomyces goshikiensis TaxID=1942 RepID=UPI00366945D8